MAHPVITCLGLGRRFAADRNGGPALEFALGAPLLLMLLVGIVQVTLVLLVQTLIEGGLREAARAGLTGYVPAGSTRDAYIRDVIQRNGYGMIDQTKLVITEQVYSNLSQIGQAGVTPTSGLGGPGDIVVYTLSYDWPIAAGLLRPVFGSQGKIHLTAAMAARNEPWGPLPPVSP